MGVLAWLLGMKLLMHLMTKVCISILIYHTLGTHFLGKPSQISAALSPLCSQVIVNYNWTPDESTYISTMSF